MKKCIFAIAVYFACIHLVHSQEIPVQPRNQSTLVSNSEWQSLESTAGKFWAMLPGKPNLNSSPIVTAAGTIMLNMYILDKGDLAYFISYSDYPDEVIQSNTTEELLENAKNGALGKMSSKKILSEKHVTINGYPAILTHAKGTLEGMQVTFKGFQLIADSRLYQVYLIGTGILDEILADRFLNSFIIDRPGWMAKFGDNSSFRYSMPGDALLKSEPINTAAGMVDFNMYILDQGNIAWFATFTDFPEDYIRDNNPIEMLNGSYNGIVAKITAKKENKKDFFKLERYDALQADVEGIMNLNGASFQVHYRGILALVNNRLYQIYSLSIGDTYSESETNYFEESFKLLKFN